MVNIDCIHVIGSHACVLIITNCKHTYKEREIDAQQEKRESGSHLDFKKPISDVVFTFSTTPWYE